MPRQKDTDLSHVSADGTIAMVDVGGKQVTVREAVAEALVRMSPATARLLARKALPKGDVLTTAKVAGILAAKQTSALIPLTHPIPLDFVDISFDVKVRAGTIRITATTGCSGRTGVEIEAMTACSVAALTIYDMCKSAEKGIVIERIRLLRKSGGKSGTWVRER
ncbi:MAG: cyclic pyranopterin monophosphate synthase MoaC [Acidobacteria bacterium]|nr:cyclic pyranopterin monophosphate synthase MoaC [Acidobacteriota bacterium]